ncbi:MAG: phage recombination protein Bet [Patescibacteria group bacterium]
MQKTKAKKEEKVEEVSEEKIKEVLEIKPPTVPVVAEGQPLIPKDFKSQLSRAQVEVIKEQFAKGATDVELKMFLYVCQRTGLDPFSKQIHLVPRWDSRLGKEVRSVIIGIDGLRSVAERTGAYAGNSDPIFDGETIEEVVKTDYKTKKETTTSHTVPSRATVTVKKVVQGVICDFTATAEWSEYYPGSKGGIMWIKMPKNMLGKCAEAKALRKAFPAVMSGLYVAEEMQQAVAVASPEVVQSDYDKAEGMIKKIGKVDDLTSLESKIEGSKKYSDEEKKRLLKVIANRIIELTPIKVDKKVAEKDPEDLPDMKAEAGM